MAPKTGFSRAAVAEATLSVAHSLDNYQLELPQELKQFVEDGIMRMNCNFNRCKALTVTFRPSHRQDDYLLYISDLATLTLYKRKGQFAPETGGVICLGQSAPRSRDPN